MPKKKKKNKKKSFYKHIKQTPALHLSCWCFVGKPFHPDLDLKVVSSSECRPQNLSLINCCRYGSLATRCPLLLRLDSQHSTGGAVGTAGCRSDSGETTASIDEAHCNPPYRMGRVRKGTTTHLNKIRLEWDHCKIIECADHSHRCVPDDGNMYRMSKIAAILKHHLLIF